MHHSWDLSFAEATALQKQLATKVDTSTPLPDWSRIAAADVSYNRGDKYLYAAVVVCDREKLEPIEVATVEAPITFPYMPGFLSFREAPSVLQAFDKLKTDFDLILSDGQGIAHPRRFGLACHLGLWLDKPAVGCAKRLLRGKYETPSWQPGSTTPLMDGTTQIGVVLRTRLDAKPMWVSPGHRCDFDSAVKLVMETTRGYRIPIPSRLSHFHVNEARRAGREAMGLSNKWKRQPKPRPK